MDLLLHDIPEAIDRALRERAAATRTTVDAVAADALGQAMGVAVTPARDRVYPGLDWFFGSDPLEQAVLDAIAAADVVHPDDWK